MRLHAEVIADDFHDGDGNSEYEIAQLVCLFLPLATAWVGEFLWLTLVCVQESWEMSNGPLSILQTAVRSHAQVLISIRSNRKL